MAKTEVLIIKKFKTVSKKKHTINRKVGAIRSSLPGLKSRVFELPKLIMKNLENLFEMQQKLDKHIKKTKGLEEQNLIPRKILALQVELGELANEHRGFKFWSENRKPKIEGIRKKENEFGKSVIEHYNPLLEEYVDCLHFLLSIGLEIGICAEDVKSDFNYIYKDDDVVQIFNRLFGNIAKMSEIIEWKFLNDQDDLDDLVSIYRIIFNLFIELGENYLGFTWKRIMQAYFEKNKTNHERQTNGY